MSSTEMTANIVLPPMHTDTPDTSLVAQRELSLEEKAAKMAKNAMKAIQEHRTVSDLDVSSEVYASFEEVTASTQTVSYTPLKFEHSEFEAIGFRELMEDAHFYVETERGILTGICDGHGGSFEMGTDGWEIASQIKTIVENKFYEKLAENHDDVHKTLMDLCKLIQETIAQEPRWYGLGSTALISFIDKTSNMIYTATVGDSEATLYREFDGHLKAVPLSCLRNWKHKTEVKRAVEIIPDAADYYLHSSSLGPVRYPYMGGASVSRSFGDRDLNANGNELAHRTGAAMRDGIIQKPKITQQKLRQGDIIVLACDGLREQGSVVEIERKIIEKLQQSDAEPNVAKRLVRYALVEQESGDNVTVITITVT